MINSVSSANLTPHPPSMSYMIVVNSTSPSIDFLAVFPLQSRFTMKNDHLLPPSGSFLLLNYLSTHEPSLLPHDCFASLKAFGEGPCWKPFGNSSRQHSQLFLIQLPLTFSKNWRSEKVKFIYKSYNNYSLAKGIAVTPARKISLVKWQCRESSTGKMDNFPYDILPSTHFQRKSPRSRSQQDSKEDWATRIRVLLACFPLL